MIGPLALIGLGSAFLIASLAVLLVFHKQIKRDEVPIWLMIAFIGMVLIGVGAWLI